MPDDLQALVGSHRSIEDVLAACEDDRKQDVFMTLGRGDDEKGEAIAGEALSEILEGALDPKHGYRYARVLVDEGDLGYETAAELWAGLGLLREWVRLSRKRERHLFLSMDGSQ